MLRMAANAAVKRRRVESVVARGVETVASKRKRREGVYAAEKRQRVRDGTESDGDDVLMGDGEEGSEAE